LKVGGALTTLTHPCMKATKAGLAAIIDTMTIMVG